MIPAELDAIRQRAARYNPADTSVYAAPDDVTALLDEVDAQTRRADQNRGWAQRTEALLATAQTEVADARAEVERLAGERDVAQTEAARYQFELDKTATLAVMLDASQAQVRDLADLLDAARTERDGALLEAAEWRDQYERMDSEIHTLRTRLGEVIQERDAVRTGCDAQMAQIVEFYGNMAAVEADHQDAQTARIVELSLDHDATVVERDRLNADLVEANEQRDLLRRRVEAVTRERDEAQAARDYARRDVALWEDEVDQRDATVRKLRRSRRKLHGRYEKILVEDRSVVTSLRAGMAVLKGRVKDADESVRTLAYEAQAEADVQSLRIAKLRRSRAKWRRRADRLNDARAVLDLVVELARRSEVPPHAPRTPLFEALLAAVRDYVAKYPVYLGVGPDAVVTKWTPTGQAFVLEAAVAWYRVMPTQDRLHGFGQEECDLHAAVAEWLQPPAAPAEPAAGTPTGPDVDPEAAERISASLSDNSATFHEWLAAGAVCGYGNSGTPLDTDHVPVAAGAPTDPDVQERTPEAAEGFYAAGGTPIVTADESYLSVTWHPDGSATVEDEPPLFPIPAEPIDDDGPRPAPRQFPYLVGGGLPAPTAEDRRSPSEIYRTGTPESDALVAATRAMADRSALHARSCPTCHSIGDPCDGCRDPWHDQVPGEWPAPVEPPSKPAPLPHREPGTAMQRDIFDADTGKWLATVDAPPSAWRPYVITSDPTWSSNALAKLAKLASPYPVIADRNDADTYLAGLLNPEAPIPIPIDRVDPDGAADDDWIGGEPGDEWVHRDDNVLTTLTAAPYPYGGGHPDHGVQITVERDHPTEYEPDRPIQCLRLPHPKAVELANWILAQYDDNAATTDAPA